MKHLANIKRNCTLTKKIIQVLIISMHSLRYDSYNIMYYERERRGKTEIENKRKGEDWRMLNGYFSNSQVTKFPFSPAKILHKA